MPEPKEGVEPQEPETPQDPATQEDVKPAGEPSDPSVVDPASPEEPSSTPSEVKPEGTPSADRPEANYGIEALRKIEKLQEHVAQLLQTQQAPQQAQQPKYSKAQLRAWALDSQLSNEQRMTVYSELDKLEKEERTQELRAVTTKLKTENTMEVQRNQSAQWVAQNFPDVTVKDNTGNFIGWNHNHPLLMKANSYMNGNESLKNNPQGFVAAVKMAAFDMGVSMNKTLSKKVNRTVGQLRKEQKKGLASTGGSKTGETPATASKARLAKLTVEYGKTGDSNTFAEIIKLKKMNPYL